MLQHPDRELAYHIINPGSLPRNAAGRFDPKTPHRCTTTLVYLPAENGDPGCHRKGASIICDPGWRNKSEEKMVSDRLAEISLTFDDIGYLFLTHNHADHVCGLEITPSLNTIPLLDRHRPASHLPLPVEIITTRGHSEDSQSLCFSSTGRRVAVVGDAVINAEYLQKQEVYRPNRYDRHAVYQSQKTMDFLRSVFDVLIPGHGPEIEIDRLASTR